MASITDEANFPAPKLQSSAVLTQTEDGSGCTTQKGFQRRKRDDVIDESNIIEGPRRK